MTHYADGRTPAGSMMIKGRKFIIIPKLYTTGFDVKYGTEEMKCVSECLEYFVQNADMAGIDCFEVVVLSIEADLLTGAIERISLTINVMHPKKAAMPPGWWNPEFEICGGQVSRVERYWGDAA